MNVELEEMITEKEAARIIGFSKGFLSQSRDLIKIPYYKIGGRYRYKKSELALWLKQRKTG